MSLATKLNNNLKDNLKSAIEAKDSDKFADSIYDAVDAKAEEILKGAIQSYDADILRARGKRTLTSKETTYYNNVISAMRQSNYKDAITNIETTLPDTVIDEVFDDIEREHNLLKHIDLQHVNAKVKVLYAVSNDVKAAWSALNGAVTATATAEFKEIDTVALKLSAYIPIPQSMLDLGPAYLDRFVRTILYQSIANGLEDAALNNLVSNTGPIGMKANITAGTTNNGVTTYTAKTAKEITEFTPKGLSTVLSAMAVNRNGLPRKLDGVFMVVNPTDYYTKVQPAVCVRNGLGEWVQRTPIPMEIVQSPYVTTGTAILGLDNQYIMTVCTAEAGKIEVSDDCDFLNDNRTYKIKLYGNGQPKDNNAFQVLNISGLKEAELLVVNNNNTVVTS